jgi:hypothetical protein
MASKLEIAALRQRIEKAERDRDALHGSGKRETISTPSPWSRRSKCARAAHASLLMA